MSVSREQFNWSDYISVDIQDPALRAEVEGGLNKIAEPTEGQELILSAYQKSLEVLAEDIRAFHDLADRLKQNPNDRKLNYVISELDGYLKPYGRSREWFEAIKNGQAELLPNIDVESEDYKIPIMNPLEKNFLQERLQH